MWLHNHVMELITAMSNNWKHTQSEHLTMIDPSHKVYISLHQLLLCIRPLLVSVYANTVTYLFYQVKFSASSHQSEYHNLFLV